MPDASTVERDRGVIAADDARRRGGARARGDAQSDVSVDGANARDAEDARSSDDDDVNDASSSSSSSSSGYGFGRESAEMVALMERLAAQRLGTTTEALARATVDKALESFDLAGVASYVKSGRAKNVVVMTGAGISVSAGIPDFRSESGLYARLGEYDLPYPQAVFELGYFKDRPGPFYRLAKELYPGAFAPTPTHYFIKLLHDKGILRRCFTQNIDSLERATGLPKEKVVPAHGNFDGAHCLRGHEADVDEVADACRAGTPMICSKCGEYVKPDIVFFGENLPRRFFECAQEDFEVCDLLIVIGTSLVVHPFAGLIERPKEDVPRLLINMEKCGEAPDSHMSRLYRLAGLGRGTGFDFDEDTNYRDALYLGACDDGIAELSELLGWKEDLDALIKSCEIRNKLAQEAPAECLNG